MSEHAHEEEEVEGIPFPTTASGDDNEDEEPEETVIVEPATRRPIPKKKKRAGVGAPAAATSARSGMGRPEDGWRFREADMLWPEMISTLRSQGRSAYDISIRLVRMDPPPQVTFPPAFSGGAVTGDSTCGPGDALIKYIDDNYHRPTAQGPVTYDVLFVWSQTGQLYGRGRLARPSPQEIMGLQRAQFAQRQGVGGPPQQQDYYPPQASPLPQYAAPSGHTAYPPPGYGTPLGYGAPPGYPPPYGYPPQPPQGPTQAEADLRAGFAALQGQLAAVLDFVKHQGVALPQGLGAPPPPMPAAPPQPPAAAPQPQVVYVQRPPGEVPSPVPMRAGLGQIREALGVLRELSNFRDELDSILPTRSGGTPSEAPEPAAPAGPPDDGLSFHVIRVPETNLKFAKDKESGDIDWGNTAFVNADSEIGQKLIGIAGDFVQSIAKLGGIKSSGEAIPGGLRQPAGVGYPPHLNGAGGGGMPNVS